MAMSFSWNSRMAAMPAAPACRQDWAFCRVTPPSARTGIACAAGFAESFQAGGLGVFFFEDGSEDGEGGLVCGGLGYFLRGVTGDCDQRIFVVRFAGRSARATRLLPCCSHFFVARHRWIGGERRWRRWRWLRRCGS